MATLLEIKTAVATYFEKVVGDLTINSQDVFLLAVNQVRRQAELAHDFEFQRRLVTLAVDGVTGGSLDAAVLYSDGVTSVTVKTVIDVGLFDSAGNLRPVEWTTVAESLVRQRQANSFVGPPWYPTDWSELLGSDDVKPEGVPLFEFAASGVRRWPKDSENDFTIGAEVYALTADWTTSAAQTITVSGATSPAGANGVYTFIGYFNNKPFYFLAASTDNLSYKIYWDETRWVVSNAAAVYSIGSTFYVTSIADLPPTSGYSNAGTTGTLALARSAGAVSDIWTTYAEQYLMWGTIVQLNHHFKHFVFRQEGNLQPPEKLRDEGLQAFKDWDEAKFEKNRRHRR